MKIRQLAIKNIGPFIEAEMCFLNDSDKKQSPVVLITGENGTGKSIILDAIRGMFGSEYGKLERDIRRRKCEKKSHIKMILKSDGKERCLSAYEIRKNDILPGPRASRPAFC